MSDRHHFRTRLKAGLEALQQQPECNTSQIAAIGYCFGGCAVLELARSGAPLQGVVSFHGELDTPLPAQPGVMQAKILVLHGDADPIVPFEKLIGFERKCDQSMPTGKWISTAMPNTASRAKARSAPCLKQG